MGDTIDALQPLPITWDPTCLPSTSEIDIYLYSPGSDLPRIHVWQRVALSRGTYTAELMPRWWNATAEQSLQLTVVPAGQPPFMSTLPGGPIFTAKYDAPTDGPVPAVADTTQVDSGITQVNDHLAKSGVSPGGKAAAVILPLLFIALCVAAYIKMKRARNREKRKQWTEKVDKRMSTISTDWKSVSGAGANAAIRNSMAVGNRNSSFSFAIRPSSTFATEGDEAHPPNVPGIGLGHQAKVSSMSQVRTGTGVGLRNPAGLTSTTSVDRVSRVSFAPDTRVSRVSFADSTAPSVGRPSGESTRKTRAFHSAYIPPVPALPDSEKKDEEEGDGSFSPRQTQGALTLTPEDIRSRIAAGRARAASNAAQQHEEKSNLDELMPALSMMRTGNDPSAPDTLLFSSPAPVSPPPPAYPKSVSASPSYVSMSPQMQAQALSSPVMHTMPMQPVPASVMSPDEMLRAYAERKKSVAMSSPSGRASPSAMARARSPSIKGVPISYPMPVAGSGASATPSNMRVLYEAATTPSPPASIHPADNAYVNRNTAYTTESQYAPSEYTAESHVIQHGQLGHHANASIGVGRYGGAQYAIGEDEDEVRGVGRAA
ncbi:hypothetical protein JR316_0012221 [Psilocybe cubensis]|uniref:Uncharacterized protein n=2 Tax=Psilocybe cubensis TaxID=181762 RepID=A0ACB8GI26_PSICU|nr:hypothetical protein JR316_0012221 [Psilocybe cubensis]KAH9475110.1 hypothetical protein JR316_0012221 [Psilocybe cubensis]